MSSSLYIYLHKVGEPITEDLPVLLRYSTTATRELREAIPATAFVDDEVINFLLSIQKPTIVPFTTTMLNDALDFYKNELVNLEKIVKDTNDTIALYKSTITGETKSEMYDQIIQKILDEQNSLNEINEEKEEINNHINDFVFLRYILNENKDYSTEKQTYDLVYFAD
jgi:hypothetical protein